MVARPVSYTNNYALDYKGPGGREGSKGQNNMGRCNYEGGGGS